MSNPEKKVELGKVKPEERKKLLKGRFKFSESEKEGMSEGGASEEEINEKEKDITKKQESARQEIAREKKVRLEAEPEKKKPSFDEYRTRQDAEFERVAKSRKDLEKAYGQEDSKQEKEEVAL